MPDFFEKEIADFITYLQVEKRKSVHTTINYELDLKQFDKFLNENATVNSISQIKTLFIRSWIAELAQNGSSPSTLARKKSSLQSFFKYQMLRNGLEQNPAKNISLPKKPKPLPTNLEQKAVEELITFQEQQTPNSDDWKALNEQTIIGLFFVTGMRRSELIAIKEADIDFVNNRIKVLGKGNKYRFVLFDDDTKKHLQYYQKERKVKFDLSENKLFFLTPSGKDIYDKYIYRLVKNFLENITVNSKKSPHTLRHTFATELINNGADISAIKDLLGHSSIAATQIYTHLNIESLKKQFRKSHPRS